MALQHAICSAAPNTRRFRLPDCPQCGDMLLAPMLSEHVRRDHRAAITGSANPADTHFASPSTSSALMARGAEMPLS